MIRYSAYYPEIVIRSTEGDSHDRPDYTLLDAVNTANWLNERAKGYPVNPKLAHLYNGRG